MNIPNQILEQNSLIPINSNVVEANGKRQHNGTHSLPPPLTAMKNLSALSMNPAMSALADLSKTVNSLQPAAKLAAFNALYNEAAENNANDNIAALAQIVKFANLNAALGSGMIGMDTSLLSKIPKSLTVIPQAKSTDRRSSDEKQNSAST